MFFLKESFCFEVLLSGSRQSILTTFQTTYIMKTSKKFLSGTLVLAILAIIPVSSAFAYQGDPTVEGPDYSSERHVIMEEAFETNDYATWAGQMTDKGRITQMITAENFSLFAEAHALAKSGDLDGSKALRAELGLGLNDGEGKKNGDKSGSGNGQGQSQSK